MNILSFTDWLGGHDTAAALVCDGALVAAAEQERFSRLKHDGSIPFDAIDYCLREAGITIEDVDRVAFPCRPFRSGRNSEMAEMDPGFLRRLRADGAVRRRALVHKRLLDVYLNLGAPFDVDWMMQAAVREGFESFRERYGRIPAVSYYDHHRSHAASVYFTSGLDRAAVVTIDGRGGSYATVTWKAEGKRIERMRAEPYTNSLGIYYEKCTVYLGLGEFGQGKTMGLASYGDPQLFEERVFRMLDVPDGGWYRYRREPDAELLGFPPRDGEPIVEEPYPHFAASAQQLLERAIARVVASALEDSKSRDLCLGGGVILNCSSNGALLASGIASSISVFPASGDAGLPVGAALLCAAEFGELRQERISHAYWGPAFGEVECRAALEREASVEYRRAENLSDEVAASLAAGKVVGWFDGRMELGPRALCHRSILADPRTVEMRDRVNRLKGREPWRPLAPVVVAERASDFFALPAPSSFMLFAALVHPSRRNEVPAVVHVDGSARPQTVTREQNPPIHDVITAFSARTRVPVVLNTSFNSAGEPIVCSPQDAIRTFLRMGLDLLVLGPYVARRRDRVTSAATAGAEVASRP